MMDLPRSYIVKADFDHVSILEPNLGFTTHSYARWPGLLSTTMSVLR